MFDKKFFMLLCIQKVTQFKKNGSIGKVRKLFNQYGLKYSLSIKTDIISRINIYQ